MKDTFQDARMTVAVAPRERQHAAADEAFERDVKRGSVPETYTDHNLDHYAKGFQSVNAWKRFVAFCPADRRCHELRSPKAHRLDFTLRSTTAKQDYFCSAGITVN
jgi:hypothetical protein